MPFRRHARPAQRRLGVIPSFCARILQLAAVVPFGLSLVGAAPGAGASETQPTGPPTWAELGDATYTGFDQLGGQVTLSHGRWEGEPFGPDSAERPSLTAAAGLRVVGDLDGDGQPEAAILLSESTGGSGTMNHLAVVGRVTLGVKHLATATLGDRVAVRSVRIENRRLSARLLRAGSGDAACCPGEVVDLAWRLDGGRLVAVGAPTIVGRLSLATLTGGEWVLRGWSFAEPAPLAPEVTLAIDGSRVVGVSGCNRYFATAKLSASRPGELEIGPLAGTRLACDEPAAGVEARYQKLLRRVQRLSFVAGQLALVYRGERGEYGTLLFEERQPGAVAPR